MYFTWSFGDGAIATWSWSSHVLGSGLASVRAHGQRWGGRCPEGGGHAGERPRRGPDLRDDFTRVRPRRLAGPTHELGAAGPLPAEAAPLSWEERSGDLRIDGGQLVNTPVKATHIATVGNLTGVDQAVAVDFTSTTNMTAPRFGILLRFTDPQNYYVAYRLVGGASLLRLARVAGDVETVLAQTSVQNRALKSPFRLRASAVGTTLTLTLVGASGSGPSPPSMAGRSDLPRL